jgi:hypothetical protein
MFDLVEGDLGPVWILGFQVLECGRITTDPAIKAADSGEAISPEDQKSVRSAFHACYLTSNQTR